MWVITDKGDARNLAHAYKIEYQKRNGDVIVYATFPICTGKNVADPAFAETAILKTFDTVDEARAYIDELVGAMNIHLVNVVNWRDING